VFSTKSTFHNPPDVGKIKKKQMFSLFSTDFSTFSKRFTFPFVEKKSLSVFFSHFHFLSTEASPAKKGEKILWQCAFGGGIPQIHRL